jgi:hypothetical protein
MRKRQVRSAAQPEAKEVMEVTAFRLPPSLIAEIEEFTAELAARNGLTLSRNNVVRRLLRRGLDAEKSSALPVKASKR